MSDLIERGDVLKEIWEWIANREYQYTNATHWLQKRIEAIPLAKDKAGRKTSNCSEKPNNCDPQTELTAKCLDCINARACKEHHWEGCRYESRSEWNEPQTEECEEPNYYDPALWE